MSTGVQMSTGVVLKILKNSPMCVMLKHEDSPGLAKLSAIRAASSRGEVRRVSILAGNGGGLFLPEELTRGADGAMTGWYDARTSGSLKFQSAEGSSGNASPSWLARAGRAS